MLSPSLMELKLITKSRGIEGYERMSKERLLSVLYESESAGSGNNFDNARIKKILKDFNKLKDGFSKSKIKEIRKNHYHIKKPKVSVDIRNKRD